MSNRAAITDQAKIALLETLIERHRDQRGNPDSGYWILKALAADARARTPASTSKALSALSFQVETLARQRMRIGYAEVGHMQAVAEAVMAHWPAIRRALEVCAHEDA